MRSRGWTVGECYIPVAKLDTIVDQRHELARNCSGICKIRNSRHLLSHAIAMLAAQVWLIAVLAGRLNEPHLSRPSLDSGQGLRVYYWAAYWFMTIFPGVGSTTPCNVSIIFITRINKRIQPHVAKNYWPSRQKPSAEVNTGGKSRAESP